MVQGRLIPRHADDFLPFSWEDDLRKRSIVQAGWSRYWFMRTAAVKDEGSVFCFWRLFSGENAGEGAFRVFHS